MRRAGTIFLAFLALQCTKQPVGTPTRPLVIRLMPARNPEAQKALASSLQEYLTSRLNATVQVQGVGDYYSIVDGFAAGTVHAAFINTMGYVAAHKWGGAEAVLALVFRSGKASYAGKIIVHRDGPVKKPQDLAGKRFAFHDRYSTAGYLLPLSYLRSKKIKPGALHHLPAYREIVLGVYQQKFDGGAIYFDEPDNKNIRDARQEILEEYPDAAEKLVILDETGRVPASPFAVARALNDSLADRLTSCLVDYSRSKEGQRLLMETYDVTALVETTDAAYNGVRESLNAAGLTEEDLVPGGYKLKIQEHLWNTSQTAP
jgi:phosphonate transport system substrate-binding protein